MKASHWLIPTEKIIDMGLTRLVRALECDDSNDEDSDTFAAENHQSGLQSPEYYVQNVKVEGRRRLEKLLKDLSDNARGVIL